MKERYEQEIEQLLTELESEPVDGPRPIAPDDAPPPDDQSSPFTPRPKAGVRLISPGKLALAGGILALIGFLPLFPVWTSLAGLAIMILAVAWMVIQRMGAPAPTYWRGRPIDEPPQGTWQRFRRWLSQ